MPTGLKGFQKGNKLGLGRKKTEDELRRFREKRIGHIVSNETRNKISKKVSGKLNAHYKDGRCLGKNLKAYNRFMCLKRYLSKKKVEGYHTFGEWETLKAQYNYTCLCCGRSESKIVLTEDHIIPLSKGGSNNIENIQPLCRSCNSKKYTKIIDFIH